MSATYSARPRLVNVDRMARYATRTRGRTCPQCAGFDKRQSATQPGTLANMAVGAERLGHMFQDHWDPS